MKDQHVLLHPIVPEYYGPYHESTFRCHKVRATDTKVSELFLLTFSRYQKASFGVCFSNKTEYPSVPYARILYSRETQKIKMWPREL